MKKSTENKKTALRDIAFGILSLVAFVLILCRSDIAIEYMKKGLRLCTQTVVPSLFPFMIISELIIKSPAVYKIGRILRRPMNFLFGVSEVGGCAFLLGAICGFPIGARTAVSAYDEGHITKDEVSRLLCFCNNPGSAFVISAIGISLFGSKQLGVLLYACVIISAVIVGIILNLISKKVTNKQDAFFVYIPQKNDMITIFTSAVSSSAIAMLTVCAYVVFFSALIGCINDIMSAIAAPDILSTLIFGFFEMTSGVSTAAKAQSVEGAVILCAAFAAWSGISVHCQIITICSGRGLSYRKYFICKAIQGLICAFLMGVSVKILFPGVIKITDEVSAFSANITYYTPTLFALLFFMSSVLSFFMLKNKKSNS